VAAASALPAEVRPDAAGRCRRWRRLGAAGFGAAALAAAGGAFGAGTAGFVLRAGFIFGIPDISSRNRIKQEDAYT
jgi:hypothetical protein